MLGTNFSRPVLHDSSQLPTVSWNALFALLQSILYAKLMHHAIFSLRKPRDNTAQN